MICKCGNETYSTTRRRCDICKRQAEEDLISEFAAGFAEADDEIRYKNPHIFNDNPQTMWTTSQQSFQDFVNSMSGFGRSYRYNYNPPPPPKPSWPKPTITYNFDKQTWRVKDQVTEGWVDVPLEMLEAHLGRHITSPHLVTHRVEIELCAKRLLILLLFGCPQRLEASYASYPERFREAFPKGWD